MYLLITCYDNEVQTFSLSSWENDIHTTNYILVVVNRYLYTINPNILFFVGCFAPVLCNKGMCLHKMAYYTNYREIYFNELHLLKKMKHNQKLSSIENKRRCGLVFDINYAWFSLSILLISRDRINIPITVVSNDSNCMPYFRLPYNQFTAKLAANICYNWN